MGDLMFESILIVLMFVVMAIAENKHREKMSLMYEVAYITSLQRTLYLCKYVLEILKSIKTDKLTSEEILEKLKEKGLGQLVGKDDFGFCNGTYFKFKPTDSIFVFINTFSQTVQDIEQELSRYWTNNRTLTLFSSCISFDASPFSDDARFLPPETIKRMKDIYNKNL